MATSGSILTGRRERRRHRLAALAAAALVTALIAPLPARAQDDFTDVEGTTHAVAIGALADLGVLEGTGCGEGMFCPDEPIERWVMAVWLIRVLGGKMTADTSRFADVDASEWWSPFAEQLAIRGITAGCLTGPLRYCPDDPVTRGQMATFLVKAFDLPEAGPAGFVDTAGNRHEARIDDLAAAGVTAGCLADPLSYCPGDPVTRGQMARFLHKALLMQKDDEMTPEPAEISDDVPDVELTDISTGETVNLRSLIPGDRAVLLWFWADW